MSEVKSVPRHGNLGVEACLLVEALKDGKPGEVKTDEELTKICGRDTRPQKPGYASLGSAIRYLIKHHGIRWRRIPKANAIHVCNASELESESGSDLDSIRRKTRRTKEKIAIIKRDELNDEQKQRLFAREAQIGVIELASDRGTTKKLEVRSNHAVPNLEGVLSLFKE